MEPLRETEDRVGSNLSDQPPDFDKLPIRTTEGIVYPGGQGSIRFFVPGIPAPAGSKKAFFNPRQPKRPIVTDDSKHSRPWKTLVSSYAVEAFDGRPLLTGPLTLDLLFVFPRPKSHYGTGKNADKLKANAPDYHTSKPDLTKLIRAVEDALNQVVWKDDCFVATQHAVKIYTVKDHPKAGVYIFIS